MKLLSGEPEKQNLKKIRVLCVNLEGNIAGAEQSLLLLIRYIPETIQITVACPAGVLSRRLKQLNVATYKILSAPRRLNPIFIWFCYQVFVNLQLLSIVFTVKPHIIHANRDKAVLAVIMAKILFRARLIYHARDIPKRTLAPRIYSFFCSQIIAVSKTVKSSLINLGIKADIIHVIYNGITTDDLRLGTGENNADCLTFANMGQLVPWKKQTLFIKAAEKFLEEGYDANFILIGDDIFVRDSKYKKSLLEKIKTSPFASRIQVEGWQDNMNPYWQKTDCLIHAADKEPFGRVIIEAMGHGVLVIAADSCGPAEIIQDGVTGLLFKPDDVEELVRAMKRIAVDKNLMRRLNENAKQYVLSNFQAKETVEKVTQVYERLLVVRKNEDRI